MLFGKKKTEEAAPEPPAATPEPPAAPEAPVAPEPPAAPEAPAAAAAPAAPAAPEGKTRVTPDYSSATTLPANHIIVNAGQGKVVLDIAKEITGEGDKTMPIESRIVMSAQTAQRLQAALNQALEKLQA